MQSKSKTPAPAVKSRLGRGLDSLITVNLPKPIVQPDKSLSQAPEASMEPAKNQSVTTEVSKIDATAGGTPETRAKQPYSLGQLVPIDKIVPNPRQPRREFPEAELALLAESIKANGVIQPIVLRRSSSTSAVPHGTSASRPADTGDRFELIAGERRWRAAKLAGLTEIPAVIRQADDMTQAQWALVENIHRQDLNPIERASAYKVLIQELGLTQQQLATKIGEDRPTIANHLRLLDLAEPVRQMVRTGELSLGHAKVLAGVQDVLEQTRLAKITQAQELSVRNLERAIANGGVVANPTDPFGHSKPIPEDAGVSQYILDLERRISGQLGMRVQLRASAIKGKGKIILHYNSLDQFDEIMQKLGVQTHEDN